MSVKPHWDNQRRLPGGDIAGAGLGRLKRHLVLQTGGRRAILVEETARANAWHQEGGKSAEELGRKQPAGDGVLTKEKS